MGRDDARGKEMKEGGMEDGGAGWRWMEIDNDPLMIASLPVAGPDSRTLAGSLGGILSSSSETRARADWVSSTPFPQLVVANKRKDHQV